MRQAIKPYRSRCEQAHKVQVVVVRPYIDIEGVKSRRQGRHQEPLGRAPGEEVTARQVVENIDGDGNEAAVAMVVGACMLAAAATAFAAAVTMTMLMDTW